MQDHVRDEAAWPRWPCPTWTSCATCSTPSPPSAGAGRPRAADRLLPAAPGRWPATWSKGGGSTTTASSSRRCSARPDLMHRILAVNADAVAAYLNAQIDAGAPGRDGLSTAGAACWPTAPSSSSAWPTRSAGAGATQDRTRRACRASSSPRAAGCGWTRSQPAAPTSSGLDWTVNLGARRARARSAPRALQAT